MNVPTPITTTATTDTPGAWLSFTLSGQVYAIPLALVREVIRYEPPTPVPGAPGDVLGIVNLRGSIISILDGARRLGLSRKQPPGSTEGERCIIFDFGEEAVGVHIDAMGDVIDLRDAEVAPPPPGRASRGEDPVDGVVPLHGGFIALLDVTNLCRMKGAA